MNWKSLVIVDVGLERKGNINDWIEAHVRSTQTERNGPQEFWFAVEVIRYIM